MPRSDADSTAAPPVIQAVHGGTVVSTTCLVRQCTHATPELGVDELADRAPPKVAVVQSVVGGDAVQEDGQSCRSVELVDVDERLRRSDETIVLESSSHHHGNHASTVNHCTRTDYI